MHIPFLIRQDCPAGQQIYRCASNGFSGCCAVDACNYPSGCPSNSPTPRASSLVLSSLSVPQASSSSSLVPSSSLKPTNAPSSNLYSTLTTGISSVPTVTQIPTLPATASPSSVQSISTTSEPQSTSAEWNQPVSHSTHRSVAPIVGGVIGGLALLIMILSILFCVRRKRRAKDIQESTAPAFAPQEGDMSNQLNGTPALDASIKSPVTGAGSGAVMRDSVADSETIVVAFDRDDEKNPSRFSNVEPDPVPHLDGTPIRPTLEMEAWSPDRLWRIPETPGCPTTASTAWGENPFESPMEASNRRRGRTSNDGTPHVMSWTEYERTKESRLSQPHVVPEMSAAVWSNMSPVKAKEGDE